MGVIVLLLSLSLSSLSEVESMKYKPQVILEHICVGSSSVILSAIFLYSTQIYSTVL